jgi:hypothetical protein
MRFSGCVPIQRLADVTPINEIPDVALGEPSFFPTIAAHTGASIVDGNRVEILLNGDVTFRDA